MTKVITAEAREAYHAQDAIDYENAKAMALYGNDELVRETTERVVGFGTHVFQIHWFCPNEADHVAALFSLFNPPEGARVLDAGCGIGAVSEYMRARNPSLSFVLQNISRAQLDLCRDDFEKIESDFHNIPLGDRSFDAVMFNYSLGHGQLDKVIAEAARLTKPGGVLFIYDFAGFNELTVSTLGYKVHPTEIVEDCAEQHGFKLDKAKFPRHTFTDHFKAVTDGVDLSCLFDGLAPAAWRFVKS
jgi:SAM-dependent methyltransferase